MHHATHTGIVNDRSDIKWKDGNRKIARIEHDAALQRVMIDLLAHHTELFKQFSDNPSFKKWLGDTIFGATYRQSAGQSGARASHGR